MNSEDPAFLDALNTAAELAAKAFAKPDENANMLRCTANEIIIDLFNRKETGQIQLLMTACHLSLKQLAPDDLRKAAENLLKVL